MSVFYSCCCVDGLEPVPSYPLWFVPFVMRWLNDNEDISMDYLNGAYERCEKSYNTADITAHEYCMPCYLCFRDKKEGFQKASIHALFSCSVTDVFTHINQCFDVLRKLESPHSDVVQRYRQRFSKTIQVVLLAYSDRIQQDFHAFTSKEQVVCTCHKCICCWFEHQPCLCDDVLSCVRRRSS